VQTISNFRESFTIHSGGIHDGAYQMWNWCNQFFSHNEQPGGGVSLKS
jgi:hypothetical protein